MAGIEAEVDLLRFFQAFDAEAGADEQHQREGDFGDHQAIAHPVLRSAGAGGAPALLQCFVEVDARRLPGREQPEGEAGGECEEQGQTRKALK